MRAILTLMWRITMVDVALEEKPVAKEQEAPVVAEAPLDLGQIDLGPKVAAVKPEPAPEADGE